MLCTLVFLLLRPGGVAAAIGDDCLIVGAACVFEDDDNIVVAHGRRLKKSDIRCNSAKICVDTANKVEISTGIWMPSVNLGTWFAEIVCLFFCELKNE